MCEAVLVKNGDKEIKVLGFFFYEDKVEDTKFEVRWSPTGKDVETAETAATTAAIPAATTATTATAAEAAAAIVTVIKW